MLAQKGFIVRKGFDGKGIDRRILRFAATGRGILVGLCVIRMGMGNGDKGGDGEGKGRRRKGARMAKKRAMVEKGAKRKGRIRRFALTALTALTGCGSNDIWVTFYDGEV